MSAQNNTTLDFSTVPNHLPISVIWRQSLKEIPLSTKIGSALNGALLLFFIFLLSALWISSGTPIASGGAYFILTLAVAVSAFTFSLVAIPLWKSLQRTRAFMRSSAFAEANGFKFTKEQTDPKYPGLIFGTGENPAALFMVTGQYQGRSFRLFNYSYTRDTGRNKAEFIKGVIMLKLPRKVPNVVFDSKSNDSLVMDSLRRQFSPSQRFTFEGDFNKHFDVYAPKNYGRDILYFMTPELMALLIDRAGEFDIETVDDDLLFYAPGFKYTPKELTDIFEVITAVGGEFLENVARYADERVGNQALNVVATPGQRLKRLNVTWFVVLIILFYACFAVYTALHDPASPFH